MGITPLRLYHKYGSERRSGNAKSIVFAAIGGIGVPVLAERANPEAIGNHGMLEVMVVVRARVSIAPETSGGDWGSVIAQLP